MDRISLVYFFRSIFFFKFKRDTVRQRERKNTQRAKKVKHFTNMKCVVWLKWFRLSVLVKIEVCDDFDNLNKEHLRKIWKIKQLTKWLFNEHQQNLEANTSKWEANCGLNYTNKVCIVGKKRPILKWSHWKYALIFATLKAIWPVLLTALNREIERHKRRSTKKYRSSSYNGINYMQTFDAQKH